MQLSENEETVVRAMAARGRESIVFREFGPSVSLTEEQVITTLLALKEKGLVEMTRTEAWLTGRGLFQAQQDDQPRRTLTREDILATPDEPDPKTNEEASRRAAEQLPEPFGGVSVPELDQLEDVPTANLGQGFNQRQLDFLAALYRARRNTGTVDWPQVASEYEIDEMLALAFLRKFKERGLVFYQDNPPNVIFHEDGVILADEILQEIGDTILTKDDIFSTPTRSDSFDENLDVHLLMSELDEEERVKAIIRSLDEREERFLLSAYRLADKWGRFNSIAVCQNAGLPERMRGRFCRELKSKALVGGDDYNKSWLEELGARVAEELSEHATHPSQSGSSTSLRGISSISVTTWRRSLSVPPPRPNPLLQIRRRNQTGLSASSRSSGKK